MTSQAIPDQSISRSRVENGSRRPRFVTSSAMMPNGTTVQNTQRQPALSTSSPPQSGPVTAENVKTAVKTPM